MTVRTLIPMRVRPKRATSTHRLPGPARRVRPRTRTAEPSVPPSPAVEPPADEHRHERRARASGGPIDNAQYACGCGYVFEAAVSTSVTCPHCGAGQAW